MTHRRTRVLRAAIITVALGSVAGLLLVTSIGNAATDQTPPQELREAASAFEGNVDLSPPEDGAAPRVSPEDAIESALDSLNGEDVEAKQATLAAFSWSAVPVDENDKPTGPPTYEDALVWAVTVEGVCAELVPETGDCINSRMNVIVDANTGKAIVAVAAEGDLVGEPLP